MRQIGIYVNKNKDKSLKITEQIVACAEKYGFSSQLIFDSQSKDEDYSDILADKEFVVVLGGDGTVLRIASSAAKAAVPLISVNLGHLGFLTALELDEIEQGFINLKNNDFTVEKRMMLSLKSEAREYYALNDFCLQRLSRARLLKFKAYSGEEFVDALSADGVLVSSPTGSTAYSLSAGGPIISPNLSLLLMTPICAHTLRARPFVFGENEILKFITSDECGFAVVCDGVQLRDLDGIKQVEISRSPYPLQLINFKQKNFFKRLENKLNEWNFSKEE